VASRGDVRRTASLVEGGSIAATIPAPTSITSGTVACAFCTCCTKLSVSSGCVCSSVATAACDADADIVELTTGATARFDSAARALAWRFVNLLCLFFVVGGVGAHLRQRWCP
jgi:hypothetical protein